MIINVITKINIPKIPIKDTFSIPSKVSLKITIPIKIKIIKI